MMKWKYKFNQHFFTIIFSVIVFGLWQGSTFAGMSFGLFIGMLATIDESIRSLKK